MLRALAVVAAVLAAGCLTPEAVSPASVDAPVAAPDALETVVQHREDLVLPSETSTFADTVFRLASTGFERGEPTIGVTSDGTIFVPAGRAGIARSTDHGRTWEEVTDPVLGPKVDLDPFIFVDPLTDRVFHLPLYVVCSWISWSDDKGDSWDNNPLGGCGIPAHDHQKLAAGPPREGTTTLGYENVVYYAYNSFRDEGTWVSRSLDGGRTFEIGQAVMPDDCHSGVNGPLHVSAEGVVYLGSAACEDVQVAVSRDSGLTWEVADVGREVGVNPYLAVNPNVATDSDGNAYVVWPGEDAQVYMSRSVDDGATWSAPLRVSPPGATSTVFSVVAAGAPGRVAVAYLATDADTSGWKTPQAQDASDDARWHLMVTFSDDATADAPTFTTIRVTPEDDPVQAGCVWLSGGGNDCRNLLDFIGIQQLDGRVYVAFADGCPTGCKDGPERYGNNPLTGAPGGRYRTAVVAIVETGPSLEDATVTLQPLA